jgi:hypothetical protein
MRAVPGVNGPRPELKLPGKIGEDGDAGRAWSQQRIRARRGTSCELSRLLVKERRRVVVGSSLVGVLPEAILRGIAVNFELRSEVRRRGDEADRRA